MRFDQTALFRFITCSWYIHPGVDEVIMVKRTRSHEEDNYDEEEDKHPNGAGDETEKNKDQEDTTAVYTNDENSTTTDITPVREANDEKKCGDGSSSTSSNSTSSSSSSNYATSTSTKTSNNAHVNNDTDTKKKKEEEVYVAPPDAFRELIDSYEYKGERVDMSSPRQCTYNRKTDYDGNPEETIILGKKVRRKRKIAWRQASYTPMKVEYRGITLRQMRAIKANINRRCEEEKWVNFKNEPLTPETVSLYEIDKYIVKPFTKDTQKSFVETLPSTGGTQDPRSFMSHYWGTPFYGTLDCLETYRYDFRSNMNDYNDARGGGMTEDTPIWICAFANNQWELQNAISDDPNQSSFKFALEGPCGNRVITILDVKGIVFSRLWCSFELYLAFTAQIRALKTMKENDKEEKKKGLWVVYTPQKYYYSGDHVAVGIISGGAPHEPSSVTFCRESHFPAHLIQMSRNIKIESADASMESDRTHILNSIAKMDDLNATPPTTHENYDVVNDAVRGAFAASMPVLNAAAVAGGDEWMDTLDRFSKCVMTGRFYINFPSSFDPPLSSSQALELMSHVPLTCDGFDFSDANGETFEGAIEGMIDWIGKAKTIESLFCGDCKVGNAEGGKDTGIRLAAALEASNHVTSIEELSISKTDLVVSGNVSEWASVLRKMTGLKFLQLFGVGDYISDEEKSILRNATHASKVLIDGI